jgi:FSR family fosmidomycin resistance protein-like MFS transporter
MSATLAVPFLIAFSAMDSAGLAVAFLIPAALFLYGSLSVSMVMGQKLLCNHIGFASGITIGLGISFGGITSPLLGYIGDHYGLEYTMWTIVVAAMISALVAWFVPDIDAIRQKRKEAAESAASVTSEAENHS